ncbi:MAG TPA: phage portal protein [Thermoguttaceae bacterium]|nr:phage portal protein [Thermoguttaceae bacterium]
MLGVTQLDVMMAPPPIQASGTARPSKWLVDWVRGDESDSGINMSTDKALSYAPVLQAITVLAGDVAQLPLDLHKRTDERNKEKDREHPSFRVARRRANPFMSAATFRETMMVYVLLHGNGVAEIEKTTGGTVKGLWPLMPHRTSREIDDAGNVWYVTRIGKEPGARPVRLRPEKVVHISNFGSDGTWGYSTLELARNSWGLGLAGEKYANRYFKNNGMPSGTIKHPGHLEETAYKRLRRDWKEMHEGLDNAARVAILEEGAEYAPLAFNHKDSQWLESRQFQRTDVASWFNLPPHKVGDLEHATFTNIEEQNRSYLDMSLMRWLVKWQDEYDYKLLSDKEKEADSHFFEFNVDALLRGDIEKRYAAYAIGIQNRIWNPNEVRAKENANTYEGGDEYIVPLNMGGEAGPKQPEGPPEEAKIRELLTCEANRVCHAAKTAKNFVGWLDAFYDRWVETMVEALPGIDAAGHVPVLCDWVNRHKEECLEAAGRVPEKEQLSARLSAVTAVWPSRAANLAEQLIGVKT